MINGFFALLYAALLTVLSFCSYVDLLFFVFWFAPIPVALLVLTYSKAKIHFTICRSCYIYRCYPAALLPPRCGCV